MLLAVFAVILMLSAAAAESDNNHCTAPPAVKGQTGTITFRFRQDVNLTSAKFYAYVRRENSLDVVNCQKEDEKESEIKCTVPDSRHYKSEGVVNRSLTVHILNVNQSDEGVYELIAFVNDARQPSVRCLLTVTRKTEVADLPGEQKAVSINLIVVVLCMVLLIAVVGSLFGIKHRDRVVSAIQSCGNKGTSRNEQLQLEGTSTSVETKAETQTIPDICGATEPLLETTKTHSPPDSTEHKRWFFKDLDSQEEHRLLKFSRNGNGSFLIRQGVTDDSAFTLAVCSGGMLKHFTITKEDDTYKFRDTGTSFVTLDDLVTHYKDNDIEIGHSRCGKLQKPFEVAPEHGWYFENVRSREEEQKLLKPGTFESGSFLIRECISFPDDYTLTVYFDGVFNHLRILPDDCGYRLCDVTPDTRFPTLAELVDNYKENGIQVDGKDYGKLVRPFERETNKE